VNRCKKWRINTRRLDLDCKSFEILNSNFRLCSRHFEDSQFMNAKREKLVWNAVPTLFDVPNKPSPVTRKRRNVIRHSPNPKSNVSTKSSKSQEIKDIPKEHRDSNEVLVVEKPLSAAAIVNDILPTSSSARLELANDRPEGCSRRLSRSSPNKKKLKNEIVRLRNRLKRQAKKASNTFKCNNGSSRKLEAASCDRLIEELSNHLPPSTVSFLKTQIKMGLVSKQGRRWTVDEKMFAMSIFYQSRKCYKLLRKIFCLPSERTLQRTLQNCSLYPGFSKQFFHALKTKMQKASEKAKDCVLMFDEMALKRKLVYNRERDCIEGFEEFGILGTTQCVADHVLVFMMRGISVKWKQPLAYFFVKGSVKPVILGRLLHDCLAKLEDIQLFPIAVICDQGPTNRCYLETLENVSVSQPFLFHGCKKVYVIYDPPHLLKNIRNNFRKHDFVLGSGDNRQNVSWNHVKEFYEFDRNLPIRMAPRLTDKHLDMPPFASMRVNLAAQVLSHSVAAGIQTLCHLGKLDKNAEHTAKFIDMFDKIFNSCNSRTIKSSQPMGHAVSKGSGHEEFFQDILAYLQVLKPARSKSELPCILGWQITIKSIIELWTNLREEKNYRFLLTSRLNQDCIENFFSMIRGSGGHRDNPDVMQFRSSFRYIAVDKLFVDNSGRNCESDLDHVLLDISSLSNLLKSRPHDDVHCVSSSQVDHEVSCEMTCEDDFDLQDFSEIPDFLPLEIENVLAYMSGYLLRKCGLKYTRGMCQTCIDLYTSVRLPSSSQFSFLQQKAFKDTGCLVYPSIAFLEFTRKLEQLFQNSFDKLQHSSGILKRLCLFTQKNLDITACGSATCDARLKYMIKLYLTVRIHSQIKYLNQQLQNSCKPNMKRNRKAKKILHE